MGILNVAIILLVLVVTRLIGKVIWRSGFLAGTHHEALMWLASIDKLFVPNWQSLPINDKDLTPEQLKWVNQLYVATYRTALEHIKLDIANIRREAVAKFQAEQNDASSGYPV
jgi:hypothetical protein